MIRNNSDVITIQSDLGIFLSLSCDKDETGTAGSIFNPFVMRFGHHLETHVREEWNIKTSQLPL
jgi:hypothetical protein